MEKKTILECFNIFITFFKIGAFTIGGGYAMLPIIEKEIVQNKKWMEHNEILDTFAIIQSIPGIIAVNASVFIGFKRAGVKGAIFAALGVVIPSFTIILLVSHLLFSFKDNTYIQNAFAGVRAGVTALILVTAIKLAKKALKGFLSILIATTSFTLIVFFNVHPVVTILAGAIIGVIGYFLWYRHTYLKQKNM
ncbi:UNVERIFIED_CONTAM: chromate transporter [Acetivibrio alkalicellulosi]